MRVLVTGAAGSIGSALVSGLTDLGHEVFGLDQRAAPAGYGDTWYTVDVTDPDAVDAVLSDLHHSGGVDAVVHLAGNPDEASLPDELHSHVTSTAILLDAMVAHGVGRIVYASSNHAVGLTPRTELLGVDVRPRPDTFYGVAKVAAEALLSLYADRHGVDAIALRIGSFLHQPETRRALSTWLSPGDAVRLVHAALTAPAPGYTVVYGVSANTRGWWDLSSARAQGYDPQDDAETFADTVPSRPEDEAEAAFVGGPLATEAAHRPALD